MRLNNNMQVGMVERDNKLLFQIFNPDDLKTFDHVPGIVYTLNFMIDPERGARWWLEKGEKFVSMPDKIYGRVESLTNTFVGALNRRKIPTGVLLHGCKGNGKTIQIHSVINRLTAQDVPVVKVDRYIPPAILRDAITLLAKVNHKLCVTFDEFEKYYEKEEEQNQLLSLFSERDLKQTLFLMAINKYDKLSEFFKDRPTRLLYSLDYDQIELEVADQIIREHVKDTKIRILMENHVRNVKPNYDQIFEIINNTVHCETVESFIDETNILNVAAFTRNIISVKEIVRVSKDATGNNVVVDVSNTVEFAVTPDCKKITISFGEFSSDVIDLTDKHGFLDGNHDQIRKLNQRIEAETFKCGENLYFIKTEGTISEKVRDPIKEIVDRSKKHCYKTPTIESSKQHGFTRDDLDVLLNAKKPKSEEDEFTTIDQLI